MALRKKSIALVKSEQILVLKNLPRPLSIGIFIGVNEAVRCSGGYQWPKLEKSTHNLITNIPQPTSSFTYRKGNFQLKLAIAHADVEFLEKCSARYTKIVFFEA